MAKATSRLTKSVSAANLERLGAAQLSALLVDAAGADVALRRHLRLELAAEIGPAELAFELDKRLQTLATSRSRISWRKRPELLRELEGLRRLILSRLAAADPSLGLQRLTAWFDLAAPLSSRVKDPKGEVGLAFDAATGDLGRLASTVGASAAVALAEAVETRPDPWAAFVGRAAGQMTPAFAASLLATLVGERRALAGRRALVVRRLADRCGDLEAWLESFSEEDRLRPEVGAEVARRLALAGRAREARLALDAAAKPLARRGWRMSPAEPPSEAWRTAEIAVLESEGLEAEAIDARWGQFERTLSPADLKALVARLADFEDVVAVDRAVAFAAGAFDVMKGLAFLMEWGALREAAATLEARHEELRGGVDAVPVWAARLESRYPLAAMRLLRARAAALAALGASSSHESDRVLSEAQALAERIDEPRLPSHDAFLRSLPRAPNSLPTRSWR